MKICFIGPANSSHIVKWCTWFCHRGHEVHVVSFTPGNIENVTIHLIDLGVDTNGSDFGKLKYLLTGNKIKKIVKEIEPDVVNVHYATSYGAAVALSGLKKYVLSVWGSDIYDFPQKSVLHKALLKFSLRKATMLFSTSQAMADEASKYTNKVFEITPFGVDMDLFNPNKRTRPYNDTLFTIGTVKSLSRLYGIDYLLEAAAKLKKDHPEIDLSIRISGDGPQAEELKRIVDKLELERETIFLGRITQEQAADEWANMDVAVIPSVLYESFGVAAVEAEASATPVVISDVEGLMETTWPEHSSIVTPRKDIAALSDAIYKLYDNPELRREMGIQGREYVLNKYELNRCFEKIEDTFSQNVGGVRNRENIKLITEEIVVVVTIKKKQDFVVGTVKGLSDKYGIKDIIKAVSEVKETTNIPIRLRIAGKGPQEEEYRELSKTLGIDEITTWLGFIDQEKAAEEWANMDVAIIPSTLESESFGVSAVEAQACGTATIISNIPGLMEATNQAKTVVLVNRECPKEIACAIEQYSTNDMFRNRKAIEGRIFVENQYEINTCFEHIEYLLKKMEREQ